MRDYEYDLSLLLRRKLKAMIKGRIFVNVFHDILTVQIKNPNDYEWEYKIEDFSVQMRLGTFNTEEIANDILKKYKVDITRKLFENVLYLD